MFVETLASIPFSLTREPTQLTEYKLNAFHTVV